MGCAASENNIIIGKKQNESNDLFKIKSINKSNSPHDLSNKEDIIKINYVNNNENTMYQMREIISKYNILEQLSNNEICLDYKLQLKSDNTKYKTLKILPKKFLGKEKKVYNEIQIINSLTNDKLMKIEEYYFDNINYYIIMEYFSLGKLSDLLTKYHTLSENQTKFIIYQLLDVALYLCSKSLVHTDIKPENILISSYYENKGENLYSIKVLNFGSNTYIKKKKDNSKTNLPFYIAPEIFVENYNSKNDIWSIGVIMYEILFGFIPFYGENINNVAYTIVNSTINFDNENLTYDCIDLIKNMLIRDPKNRFDVNKCISHPWFNNINELILSEKKDISNKIITQSTKVINESSRNEEDEKENKNEFFKTIINDFKIIEVKPQYSIKISTKRNSQNKTNYFRKDIIYQSLKYIHHYYRKKYHIMDEMEYLKVLFEKYKINDEINFENTILCFKQYCGYNNSLINDLILEEQLNDKLKVEISGNELNLIEFQNFLIKEKENDIKDKLWKSFSNLESNNKYDLIKCFNETKYNSKYKQYFDEIINEMNEEKLKENYLFYEYENLIKNVVDKIENENRKKNL